MVIPVIFKKFIIRSINCTSVVVVEVIPLYCPRRSTNNLLSGCESYLGDIVHRLNHCRSRQPDCYHCQTVDHVAIRICKRALAEDDEMEHVYDVHIFSQILVEGLQMPIRNSMRAYWSINKTAPLQKWANLATVLTKLQSAARRGEQLALNSKNCHKSSNSQAILVKIRLTIEDGQPSCHLDDHTTEKKLKSPMYVMHASPN